MVVACQRQDDKQAEFKVLTILNNPLAVQIRGYCPPRRGLNSGNNMNCQTCAFKLGDMCLVGERIKIDEKTEVIIKKIEKIKTCPFEQKEY